MRDTPGGPAPVAWPGRRSVLTLALGMSVGLPLARLAGAEDADLPSRRSPADRTPVPPLLAVRPHGRCPRPERSGAAPSARAVGEGRARLPGRCRRPHPAAGVTARR